VGSEYRVDFYGGVVAAESATNNALAWSVRSTFARFYVAAIAGSAVAAGSAARRPRRAA